MQLSTKYFGVIEFESEDALSFPNGLFGFEDEKEFALLPFHGSDGNLLCFQSTKTPGLAFVAMNPFSLNPAYTPVLSQEELDFMQVSSSHELCYYVLCVVREPVKDSTVNLKCPVVVEKKKKRAIQVILETKDYHMRHPLSEFRKEGADVGC